MATRKLALIVAVICAGMVIVLCFLLKAEIPGPDRKGREKRAIDCESGPCRSGEYLNGAHCQSCPPETFLDLNYLHGCLDCRLCSQPEEYHGIVVKEQCTSISDTVLGCGPGYYRVSSSSEDELECMKCLECEKDEIKRQQCSYNTDTVCGKATSPMDILTKKPSTSSADTPTQKPTLNPTNTSTRNSSSRVNTNSDDKSGIYLGIGLTIGTIIVIIMIVIVVRKTRGRRRGYAITNTRPGAGLDKIERGHC